MGAPKFRGNFVAATKFVPSRLPVFVPDIGPTQRFMTLLAVRSGAASSEHRVIAISSLGQTAEGKLRRRLRRGRGTRGAVVAFHQFAKRYFHGKRWLEPRDAARESKIVERRYCSSRVPVGTALWRFAIRGPT